MHRRIATIAVVPAVLLTPGVVAQTIVGVTEDQRLVSFAASDPGRIQTGVAIGGLMSNERLLGIDYRPATGGLYGLGSFGNLYEIDATTGAAMRVGTGPAAPLNGSSFGFDFNPVIDRIRVVSDADQNIVLNPNDGSSTVVTPLFYAAGDANEGRDPNVGGSAYTNSVAGAGMTQLYGIDTGLDVLVRQANSAGTLDTVGSLGVDLTDLVGFDIDGMTGQAFAAVVDVTLARSTFWSIDLATGAATQIGQIGGGAQLTAIAVAPGVIPSPGALAIAAVGALGAARRRRGA